jgi:hypothetical protein
MMCDRKYIVIVAASSMQALMDLAATLTDGWWGHGVIVALADKLYFLLLLL